jgi:hypothetical protein
MFSFRSFEFISRFTLTNIFGLCYNLLEIKCLSVVVTWKLAIE